MALVIKDPGARIDYMMDWGADYLDGQHIAESGWSVNPIETGGLFVVSHSHDLLRAAVQVEGGRAGTVYRLTNRVTLSDGQIDERSLVIRVEDQ